MPWVATDKADGKVYIYSSEPVLRKDSVYFDNDENDSEYMSVDDFPNPPAPGEKRQFKWSDVVAPDATERVNKDIERMVFRDILRELVSVQDGGHPPSRLNSVTERARRALAEKTPNENEKIAKQIADTQKQSEKMRCGRCGSTALTLEVFNFGKRFACKNCFAIFGYNDKADEPTQSQVDIANDKLDMEIADAMSPSPVAVELAVIQENIRERLQPGSIIHTVSLAQFSDEERPVAAVSLVRIIADVAKGARKNGWSVETLLEIVAERIGNAAGLSQGKR